MRDQEKREEQAEFELPRFMAKETSSGERAERCGEADPEQRCFGNAPIVPFGFALIHEVNDERGEVDPDPWNQDEPNVFENEFCEA